MDLNLLSQFVVVAEAESFTDAARRLGLRRSSVSRSVAALERELGVQLFNRTTRHVALTTAGAALLARVAPQLAALREAVGSLPEQEEQPSGELRLTAPTDMGSTFLPQVIAAFTARYPGVRVDLRVTNRMVDLVAEGFDLALRAAGSKLQDSSLVARKLSPMEMQLFASPTYLARRGTPRTAQDTASHEWLSFRGGRPPPPLAAPRQAPRVVGDDMLFMHQAVRAGCGLGLLPTFLARDDVSAGQLVRVLPRFSVGLGGVYLVHPQAQHVPRKVKAFRDLLVEHLAAHPLVAP